MKTILACIVIGLFSAITIYLVMPYCISIPTFIHFLLAAYVVTFSINAVCTDVNNFIKKLKKDGE